MYCCSHCQDAGNIFDNKTAKKELRRYLRRGHKKTTRLLLDEIKKDGVSGLTLLDIGGGIGVISFDLLESGLECSVSVDASPAYQSVVRGEAERRGVAEKVEQVFGDYTEVCDGISDADIVTLDRVVCCYPDMEKLLDRSVDKSRRYYGLVYPRDRWMVRLAVHLGNLYFRMRRNDFRTFVHSPEVMDAGVRGKGFRVIAKRQTVAWEVAVYERVD